MGKKSYRQYDINTIEDAMLVLSSLIIPVTIDLEKFERYADEAKDLLQRYNPGDMIPAEVYDSVHDKLLYQQRELLRFIADYQKDSFAYIDVRKELRKRKYLTRGLDENVNEILNELLDIRGLSFHNSQAMLNAEKEITNHNIPKELEHMVEIKPQLNPVVIRKITSYPWEMLASFVAHNEIRQQQFETVLSEMKADYQAMYDTIPNAPFIMGIGKSVKYVVFPVEFDWEGNDSSIAQLAMGIQRGKYDGTDESYEKIIGHGAKKEKS